MKNYHFARLLKDHQKQLASTMSEILWTDHGPIKSILHRDSSGYMLFYEGKYIGETWWPHASMALQYFDITRAMPYDYANMRKGKQSPFSAQEEQEMRLLLEISQRKKRMDQMGMGYPTWVTNRAMRFRFDDLVTLFLTSQFSSKQQKWEVYQSLRQDDFRITMKAFDSHVMNWSLENFLGSYHSAISPPLSLEDIQPEAAAPPLVLEIDQPAAPAPPLAVDDIQPIAKNHECKICTVCPFCVVFTPCGHMFACQDCSGQLSKCPICQRPIGGRLKVFM
jgi:Zinc finger, C3HC4 type (RING finger)